MSEFEKKTFIFREYVLNILFVLLSVGCCAESWRIFSKKMAVDGPGTLPLVLSVAMLICSVVSLIEVIKKHKEEGKSGLSIGSLFVNGIRTEFPLNVVGTVLITIGYLIILKWLIFIPATAIYLAANILFLGRGKKINIPVLILVPIGMSVVIYVLFQMIFLVILP